MKPAPFSYHRARGVGHAVELLAAHEEAGEEAKVLAGGLSLVPMMNLRLARPDALVDITRVDGLSYARAGQDGLRVGALTTHRSIETAALGHGFGVLSRAARWIGHYPIRSRGTLGGSIAHADPASEWCLLALLLAARMRVTGPDGERYIEAGDFFGGYYTTALAPADVLTEAWFPRPAPHAALTEFAVRQGDFAIVAAAAAVDISPDGICVGGRVALGGVGATPVLVDAGPLTGQPAGAETWRALGAHAASQLDPPGDLHGSAEYRRHLAGVLVARALAEAAAQPSPGSAA